MSNESWIGIVGIAVTLALSGAGTVFAVGGWFITRLINEKDKQLAEQWEQIGELRDEIGRLKLKAIQVETVLIDRGYLRGPKYPSPPPHNIEGGQT